MPVAKTNALQRLQNWYLAWCSRDWEHTYGVSISTLDNAGWTLDIELSDTSLAGKPFTTRKEDTEHSTDWIHCSVSDLKFRGACGSLKLESLIEIFLAWAEES